MGRSGTWGDAGTRERTSPANWRKPLRWNTLAGEGLLPDGTPNPDGHRPRVFCASLADVFEPRDELTRWRAELFDLIRATPSLDWLILTKRPDVARDFIDALLGPRFPEAFPNVWMGTSIENARFTFRADVLRECRVAVRFLSCEPLLGSLYPPAESESLPPVARGPISRVAEPAASDPARGAGGSNDPRPLEPVRPGMEPVAEDATERGPDGSTARGRAPLDLTGIDQVIVGGESGGPGARPPHPTWVREIRDAILRFGFEGIGRVADLPPRPALLFKQWGSYGPRGFAGGLYDTVIRRTAKVEYGRHAYADQEAATRSSHGSWDMAYYGAAPNSAGCMLEGREWHEFPDSAAPIVETRLFQ